MAIEIYDETAALEKAYARVLILGAYKTGKTTAVLSSAPQPIFVINCDGRDAVYPAKRQGARYMGADVKSIADWNQCVAEARKRVDAGNCRTVVLDTLTFLQDTVIDEVRRKGAEGWDVWTHSFSAIKDGLKPFGMRGLLDLDAHVIIIAHIAPGSEENPAGLMPAVGGQLKTWLPGIINDAVILDCNPNSGERSFLLGPQSYWNHSGRNVRKTQRIPADVGKMLEAFGIAP